MHGAQNTAVVAESQQAAISRIEEIAKTHEIACDFHRVPGFMYAGPAVGTEEYNKRTPIRRELYRAANATHKLQLSVVDSARISGFDSGPAIRFDNQACFHPTKYLKGLASVITNQLGGQIYEQTHMNSYEDSGADKGGITATFANGTIVKADTLIMATNIPLQKVK